MITVMYCIIALSIGALAVLVGTNIGRKQAILELDLKATLACKEAGENPFIPMSEVQCPCRCGGVLFNVGKNRADTNTCLECAKCRCAYVAYDEDKEYERRTGEPRGAGADWAGRERGDFSE